MDAAANSLTGATPTIGPAYGRYLMRDTTPADTTDLPAEGLQAASPRLQSGATLHLIGNLRDRHSAADHR